MANDVAFRARIFATAAHHAVGQVRKYTGEPYINHPAEVVAILAVLDDVTPRMIAAAWLHDVVEDTGVPLSVIREEFGDYVAVLVEGLTDVSRPEDGNRSARKALDRAHASKQTPACKTIKLADLISNTRSIVAHDPEFAKVYLAEKRLLLEVLREGNRDLWARAARLAGLGQ